MDRFRFFDYKPYSDAINTAARLEAANKPLGTSIFVSVAAAGRATGVRGRQPVGSQRSI